jgi:hypothetical protein
VRTDVLTVAQARPGHEASCEGLPDDAQMLVYHLVLPAGMTAPLAHTARAEVRMAANQEERK